MAVGKHAGFAQVNEKTNTMKAEQGKQQQAHQNFGPGNVLRAKREEYEWSVESVAQALHLSTANIKAIEDDRYDQLPGSTYVIGYWRSYARLLGINIEETIEANKRNLHVVQPKSTGINVNKAMPQSSSQGKGSIWLLLSALVLAGLGYAWYSGMFNPVKLIGGESNDGLVEQSTPNNGEEQDENEGVLRSVEDALRNVVEENSSGSSNELNGQIASQPVTMASEQAIQSSAITIEENTAQSDLQGTLVEPSINETTTASAESILQQEVTANTNTLNSDTVAAQVTALNTSGQQGETQQTNPEVQTDQTSLLVQTDPVVTDSTQSANVTQQSAGQNNTVATQSAELDEGLLELTLTKDSWLDVRDVVGDRLIYRSGKSGEVIELRGQAPFYVYIGTPTGVQVKYLNKDVPFQAHQSGLFARFKLGKTLEQL